MRTTRQEAARKRHQKTEAENLGWRTENPQAAREEQEALLATDVDATFLHDYVAATPPVSVVTGWAAIPAPEPQDAGKRPRDEGGGGGKATSKQARSDTSRAASSTATPELLSELDSPDKRVEELQDQIARLQEDFDLFRAYHTGQMERKDKDHARENARTDKEWQQLVASAEHAEGERDAAIAAARAATDRADRAETLFAEAWEEAASK